MQRSFSTQALVLKVKPTGESNREAVFLSADEGIISAVLFGGPKSRLRSHVSPFNTGTLWIYRDPAKDFRKVSDFDVQSWRPGLRERYERSNTASLVAASVLNSKGGGAFGSNAQYNASGAYTEAYDLTNKVLDALENADAACCQRIHMYFMWNWSNLLGHRSDLQHCDHCSCNLETQELLWFVSEEGFLCGNCFAIYRQNRQHQAAPIGAGARKWLLAVQDKSPSEIARYRMDAASLEELERLCKVM